MFSGEIRSKLAFATLCVAAIGCQVAQIEWQEFQSPDSSFRATFPGTPEREVLTVNSASGPVRLTKYSVEWEGIAFVTAVAEMPQGRTASVGERVVLDGARDGAVANVQGTLLSEQIIEVNGHPGREFKISVADGTGSVKSRIFLAHDQLFQAMVASSVKDSYRPEIAKFLEAFEPM